MPPKEAVLKSEGMRAVEISTCTIMETGIFLSNSRTFSIWTVWQTHQVARSKQRNSKALSRSRKLWLCHCLCRGLKNISKEWNEEAQPNRGIRVCALGGFRGSCMRTHDTSDRESTIRLVFPTITTLLLTTIQILSNTPPFDWADEAILAVLQQRTVNRRLVLADLPIDANLALSSYWINSGEPLRWR